jgi:hypothetical protein
LSMFAEEGGHGMFRQKRPLDSWEDGGPRAKVEPKETVESLREHFMNPEPVQLMEDDGTIKGKSANFIGMWAKPKVPWARFREYALPISTLLAAAEEEKERLLSRAPRALAYTVPGAPEELVLSIPYDKPTRRENLDEALHLQLITRDQYEALV